MADGNDRTDTTDLSGVPYEDLVREQLRRLGEDPDRHSLLGTPARVEKAMMWLMSGYRSTVEEAIGSGVFQGDHDNMVLVKDIELYSMCEHHMLPFFGKVHVAYIPNGRLLGLSKVARVVEVFARRLQVQERLTDEIADAIVQAVEPDGVGVVVEAYHRRGLSPVHDDARNREAEQQDDHECGSGEIPIGPPHA